MTKHSGQSIQDAGYIRGGIMLKWVWTILIVLMMTMPVSAQKVFTAPCDLPLFSSPEVMVTCVAQFAMGDRDFILKAAATGKAHIVRKGTTLMLMEVDDSGIIVVMEKGKAGVWFSHAGFCQN